MDTILPKNSTMLRSARSARRWLRCLLCPSYVAHLEDIIRHVAIHGAYQKGGYNQMTTEQKRTVDRLGREPWSFE